MYNAFCNFSNYKNETFRMILRSFFYGYSDLLLITLVFYLKAKGERSELLEDISRYSGILDNHLLLSRTEFLRVK